MIFAHLPGTAHQIEFPMGNKSEKYLVADPSRRCVVVMERGTEKRVTGYREVLELNEDNLYMLPPFFRDYTRRWWEKWGI